MTRKVYIPMPKGLTMPEGTKDGDTVELLTEFRLEGKRLCVLKIEDAAMGNGEDDGEDHGDEAPGGSEFEKRYNIAMGPGSGPQAMMG